MKGLDALTEIIRAAQAAIGLALQLDHSTDPVSPQKARSSEADD
jgi:hypothetical protein